MSISRHGFLDSKVNHFSENQTLLSGKLRHNEINIHVIGTKSVETIPNEHIQFPTIFLLNIFLIYSPIFFFFCMCFM